ncbi:MAG: osmoprotectant transport system permease protein [Thermoleophilaceae bacterium]|jgi:osmoprotectant transport system permease protein|nr:osmoprotectant transport system permease protein [Thermoleophilaceae bacterium]
MLAAVAAPLAATVVPDFGRSSNCVRNDGTFCWDWFQQHWGDTFQPRLIEHIELSAIALGIGFAIAFAAALVANRYGWFETPFSILSGFLYTIPSLALFQVLVPITGIGWTTVEIPLVSYTLLIIFRNTLTGLREVPDDVREAARGMGLTPAQTLWRVELPLAMPAIIAGVRVAAVTVISLATVAAIILPEGLGYPIFLALQSPFNTQFIAAGALAVLLAITTDALLVIAQRFLTPWARMARS